MVLAQGQGGFDNPQREASASLGSMLRAARLEKDLTLEAVEAETRIRRRFLEAIEADRYDQLPGVVYARGFVKLYARAVGLDPARVAELFDQQLGRTSRARPARERPAAPRERPAPARAATSGSSPWWAMPDPILRALEPARRIRHAGALALVVVTVAAAGAWLLSRLPRPTGESTVVALPQVATGGEAAGQGPQLSLGPAPDVPSEADALPSLDRVGLRGELAPAEPATLTPGAAPGIASTGPGPVAVGAGEPGQSPSPASPAGLSGGPSGSVVLVARVRDRSWMEVWADGRRIFSRTAQAGEVLTWTAQQTLTVRFGRPEVVDLELNGQPLGVAGTGVITRTFSAQTSGPLPAARPAASPRPNPLQPGSIAP